MAVLIADAKLADTSCVSARFASASNCFHPFTNSLSGRALLVGVNGSDCGMAMVSTPQLISRSSRSAQHRSLVKTSLITKNVLALRGTKCWHVSGPDRLLEARNSCPAYFPVGNLH